MLSELIMKIERHGFSKNSAKVYRIISELMKSRSQTNELETKEKELKEFSGLGKDALYSALDNLEKLGLIERSRTQYGMVIRLCKETQRTEPISLKQSVTQSQEHEENISQKPDAESGKRMTQEKQAEIAAFCIENGKNYKLVMERYGVTYGQIYSWVRKFGSNQEETQNDKNEEQPEQKQDQEKEIKAAIIAFHLSAMKDKIEKLNGKVTFDIPELLRMYREYCSKCQQANFEQSTVILESNKCKLEILEKIRPQLNIALQNAENEAEANKVRSALKQYFNDRDYCKTKIIQVK